MQQEPVGLIPYFSERNHKYCFLSISEVAFDEVLQATKLQNFPEACGRGLKPAFTFQMFCLLPSFYMYFVFREVSSKT